MLIWFSLLGFIQFISTKLFLKLCNTCLSGIWVSTSINKVSMIIQIYFIYLISYINENMAMFVEPCPQWCSHLHKNLIHLILTSICYRHIYSENRIIHPLINIIKKSKYLLSHSNTTKYYLFFLKIYKNKNVNVNCSHLSRSISNKNYDYLVLGAYFQ